MKKVKQIYLIVMSIAVLLLIFSIILFNFDEISDFFSEQFDKFSTEVDEAKSDGEVDDVEGYGIIAKSSILGLGVIGAIMYWGVAFIMGAFAVILIIISSIAMAFYKPEGARLNIYRVIMALVYILLAMLDAAFLSMLFKGFSVPVMVCVLILTPIILYCLVNTYSKRIIQ